jgi:hypothetical protein
MAYVIEKGVPVRGIPQRAHMKYPFADMEVGDSFEVTDGNFASVRDCARKFGERHGMVFSSRQTAAGLRVWRIA